LVLSEGVEELRTVGKKRPWERKLYVQQDYPDNYVDKTFLVGLVTNADLQTYDLATLVYESTAITSTVSLALLFFLVFSAMYDGLVDTRYLLGSEMAVFGLVCLHELLTKAREDRRQSISSLLTLALLTLAMTPVLGTLTKSVSTDTIFALSVLLLVVHLAFSDYGYLLGKSDKFAAPLALNAAVSASVLLASRLSSKLDVFAFVAFSMMVFALLPIARHNLLLYSGRLYLLCTLAGLVGVGLLALSVSPFLFIVYSCGILFISLICPFLLIWAQAHKNTISGPWDESTLDAETLRQ